MKKNLLKITLYYEHQTLVPMVSIIIRSKKRTKPVYILTGKFFFFFCFLFFVLFCFVVFQKARFSMLNL